MNDKYHDFDADKLFERKNNFGGYRHCPWCRQPLVLKNLDGYNRLTCQADGCGFIFYQNPVPAAGAIVVEDGRVLLVKRAHPPRIGWWCIPAGFMEWHEHPSETAVRELKEETGLDVKLTSFFEVYTGEDDPRVNAVLMLYLGKVTSGRMEASDDALDVGFFEFDHLPEKIAFQSHIRALSDYQRRFGKGS